jgi:hypothetical protein
MDNAFISEHMLEETRDRFESNLQSKTSTNGKDVSQCKIYWCPRHAQWYGEVKHCCMCGDNEDWIHVLTCKSLDTELIRAESWNKLIKGMEKWGMSQDMLLTIENGVRHYTMNPNKREHDNIPTEPSPPFRPTFYAPRNRLKVAFHAQS